MPLIFMAGFFQDIAAKALRDTGTRALGLVVRTKCALPACFTATSMRVSKSWPDGTPAVATGVDVGDACPLAVLVPNSNPGSIDASISARRKGRFMG